MNHPKLTKALAALDDARTEVHDVIEAGGAHVIEHADELFQTLKLINLAALAMPHVQVPNTEVAQ